MQAHPDFANVDLPRRIDLGACHLTPLTGEQVAEDFDMVTRSASLLEGVFEGWPGGLTRDENFADLVWHNREFELKRSFSWIIRAPGGAYLGCLYLFPSPGTRGLAEGVFWLGAIAERDEVARCVLPVVKSFLSDKVPRAVTIGWRSSPAIT